MSWYNNWQARNDARHFRRKRVEEAVSWACMPVILVTGWLVYDQARLTVERAEAPRAQLEEQAKHAGPTRQAVPLTPEQAAPMPVSLVTPLKPSRLPPVGASLRTGSTRETR